MAKFIVFLIRLVFILTLLYLPMVIIGLIFLILGVDNYYNNVFVLFDSILINKELEDL